MYYKIVKGGKSYEAYDNFASRAIEANKVCIDYIKKLAADRGFNITGAFLGRAGVIGGGLLAIQFKPGEPKPDKWRQTDKRVPDCYSPIVQNKEGRALMGEWNRLPKVMKEEGNKALNFVAGEIEGTARYCWNPSAMQSEHYGTVIYEIPDGLKYSAPLDAIEILGSEYMELKAKFEAYKKDS